MGCERVKCPRPLREYSDDDPNALNAGELRDLFDAMRDTEPHWLPLFTTMGLTYTLVVE
jgi:hypothetical protein